MNDEIKGNARKLEQDKQFIRLWVEAYLDGRNQSWLAKKLGHSRQYVSARALYMYRNGVKLPMKHNYTARKQRDDAMRNRADKLNEFISELIVKEIQ